MKIVNTKNAPAPIGPYNQAIAHKGTLYISGQVAIDAAKGEMIAGDLKAEAHQVMKNLGAILESEGLDFSDLIKCSIFLLDMGQFHVVNEVYGSYFSGHFPARETIEVRALPAGAHVEISAIAAID